MKTLVLHHRRLLTPFTSAFGAALKRDRPLFCLSIVSSTDPRDESTKAKLRCNLLVALNDARLLLEPSELNIHPLIMLAVDVLEFTRPSLSWMLVTNACSILQGLGVSHRRFDSPTRERRIILFWHLNLVDIGLALIFGRPPTFHRGMVRFLCLH